METAISFAFIISIRIISSLNQKMATRKCRHLLIFVICFVYNRLSFSMSLKYL